MKYLLYLLLRKRWFAISKIYKVGDVNYNSYGTKMKIIEYIDSVNIMVEFQDEHKIITHTTPSNFKRGTVKNPYDRSAYGVGFIGVGDYMTGSGDNHYPTKEYTSWKN